jgi:hypothetical protein
MTFALGESSNGAGRTEPAVNRAPDAMFLAASARPVTMAPAL